VLAAAGLRERRTLLHQLSMLQRQLIGVRVLLQRQQSCVVQRQASASSSNIASSAVTVSRLITNVQ